VTSPDGGRLAALVAARGWHAVPATAVGAPDSPASPGAPGSPPVVPSSLAGPATVEVLDVTPAAVGAAAFAAGVELHELTRIDAGLEALFLQLVGDGEPTGAHGAVA
jgi:ABC-2 type transport system ATP-binding protein